MFTCVLGTDELSFKKTAQMLAEVAKHGEDTGYEVPSLIVSAKDDLNSFTKSIKDSTRVNSILSFCIYYVPFSDGSFCM